MNKEEIGTLIEGGIMTLGGLGGVAGTCGTLAWIMNERVYNPMLVLVVGLPAMLTLFCVERLSELFDDSDISQL